jgi:hypothetical protein
MSSSVYPPPHSIIVAASLSMYLPVWCCKGCWRISAADHWELVRLILFLLSLVTGLLVVVQGVLMSIDDAYHATPAAPFKACAPKFSPAYPPRYRTFKDNQQIKTSMPKVQVHCYLQILTGTNHY